MAVLTDPPPVAAPEPDPSTPGAVWSGSTVGGVLRWVIAAAALGAAVLHFGYSPSHFDRTWEYGAFLVAIAWLQVAVAVGLVSRPSRLVLLGAITVNVVVVGVWIASRTVGVAIGPDASTTLAVGYPDALATSLETLVVLGAVVLLAAPHALDRRGRTAWATPLVVTLALVLVAGSAAYALTPHFTAQLDASGGSRGTNDPRASAAAASSRTSAGAGSAGPTNPALTGDTPCEKSGPPASEGQVFDSAGHFHRGPNKQVPVDEPTRLTLEFQQAAARAVAQRYPTVADAERAGYRKSTVYVPCIGAHYTNIELAKTFDPSAPSELLYDGTNPDSRIVGLSYLVFHDITPPEGFAGPNDIWHQHTFNGGLCIDKNGLVVGAESTSAEDCAARGGHKAPLTNVWMVHDWVVPGFECSWGVFASECPELGGRAGGTAWDR
ncbi:MAG TPA: hypothetical protein VFC99_12490 [Acidimicrobiia bacterium]|nr:hypothetical protein [Acidimicrobiia bacterium]